MVDVCLQGTIMDMLTDVNTGIGWVMEKIGQYGGGWCHPTTCPNEQDPSPPISIAAPCASCQQLGMA